MMLDLLPGNNADYMSSEQVALFIFFASKLYIPSLTLLISALPPLTLTLDFGLVPFFIILLLANVLLSVRIKGLGGEGLGLYLTLSSRLSRSLSTRIGSRLTSSKV